jgi:hypothetical protein
MRVAAQAQGEDVLRLSVSTRNMMMQDLGWTLCRSFEMRIDAAPLQIYHVTSLINISSGHSIDTTEYG